MALPGAFSFRRLSTTFVQEPAEDITVTASGAPWVRVRHTDRKRIIEGDGILTDAEFDTLIADYAANHSTSFSFTDPRDSSVLTVKYEGRPTRKQRVDGVIIQPTHCLAVVRLREV